MTTEPTAFASLYRRPGTEDARGFVAAVTALIQAHENAQGLRQRRRRPKDQQTFEAVTAALLCDIAHRTLSAPHGWLAVTRDKAVLGSRKDRYTSPLMTEALPGIVDCLAALGFLEVRPGWRPVAGMGPGRMTTIRATDRLAALMDDHAVTLADLEEDPDQEVIILSDGRALDYVEDETTRQHRADLRRINDAIRGADITIDHSVLSRPVDPGARLLRRHFSDGEFDKGGRLFGGFWQPMKKTERGQALRIAGEAVAVLDFGQMGLRMAYAQEGATVPPGDAYAIPGMTRDGVKLMVSALLFADRPLVRMPKGARKFFGRITVADVTNILRQHYAPIAHHFGTRFGMGLMYQESTVLLRVLLTLLDAGIVALPIHDAIVVQQSAADHAQGVMLESFRSLVGADGVVSREA
jgi:hypothetical protein